MRIRLPFLPTLLFSIQVFVRRIFFLPSSYIVPYLYFNKIYFSSITYFYIFYSIYSLFISTDKVSTIIYSILFILNTLVFNSIKSPKVLVKEKIILFNEILKNILILFSLFSLLLWTLNVDILPNKIFLTIFNPLNGLNINSYIFIIYYFSFTALYLKKEKDLIFGCTLLLLTESRTAYIFFIFLTLQYLEEKEFLPNFNKINFKGFLPVLLITCLITPIFWGTNYFDNIKHNINTSIEFANNIFLSKDEIQSFNYGEEKLSDSQRLCLTINNTSHIFKTFPFGTGIGLKSYQNSLEKNQLGCKSQSTEFDKYDFIRAHNFYISYLAEMGIFFFPLLIFISKNIYKRNSKFIILGLMIAFLGHEYLTSPYTWMVLGLSERRNYA